MKRSVVLYSSTTCANCKTTEAILDHMLGEGNYTVKKVDQDAEAMDDIALRGFRSVPVVRVGDEWFDNHNVRPMELAIEKLKKQD